MTFSIPPSVAEAWERTVCDNPDEPLPGNPGTIEAMQSCLGAVEYRRRAGAEPWPLSSLLLHAFPWLGSGESGLKPDQRVRIGLGSALSEELAVDSLESDEGQVSGAVPRMYGEAGATKVVVSVGGPLPGRRWLILDTELDDAGSPEPIAVSGERELRDAVAVEDFRPHIVPLPPDAPDLMAFINLLHGSEVLGAAMRALDELRRSDENIWQVVEGQRIQFMVAEAAMQMMAARASLRVTSEEATDAAFPYLAAATRLSCLQAARSLMDAVEEISFRRGGLIPTAGLRRSLEWCSNSPWTELELRERVGRGIASGFSGWDVLKGETRSFPAGPMRVPSEIADLRSLVKEFVDDHLVPLETRLELDGDLDPETWSEIEKKGRDLGLNALSVPTEFGGAGLGMLGQVVVAEAMGHVAVGFRHVIGSPAGAQVLARFGTVDQQERYLRPWIAGKVWGAWAATEPNAGSDLGSMATRATRVDGGWILDGNKHFITGADRADFFILFARTTNGVGVKGLTAFLIDKSAEGLHVGREQRMMGRGGLHSFELHLDSIVLDDTQRLGPVDGGFRVLIGNVNELRVLVSAHCVGVADRLLRIGQEWSRNRRQFGQPIGELGAIQGYLADSLSELLESRAAVYHAAWAVENNPDSRNETAAVKALCTEMVGRVADRTMQLLGGYGYCKDLPVEALFRAVRLWRIAEGSSEIQRMLLWRGISGGWWPDMAGLGMAGGDTK